MKDTYERLRAVRELHTQWGRRTMATRQEFRMFAELSEALDLEAIIDSDDPSADDENQR